MNVEYKWWHNGDEFILSDEDGVELASNVFEPETRESGKRFGLPSVISIIKSELEPVFAAGGSPYPGAAHYLSEFRGSLKGDVDPKWIAYLDVQKRLYGMVERDELDALISTIREIPREDAEHLFQYGGSDAPSPRITTAQAWAQTKIEIAKARRNEVVKAAEARPQTEEEAEWWRVNRPSKTRNSYFRFGLPEPVDEHRIWRAEYDRFIARWDETE